MKYLQYLLLFSATLFIFSCSDDEAPANPYNIVKSTPIGSVEAAQNSRISKVISDKTLSTNFNVTVQDTFGTVIEGATVKIANESATTNQYGIALIEDLSVNEDLVAINAMATGYVTAHKTITPSSNGLNNVVITLLPKTTSQAFTAATGSTLTFENSTITFPASGIVDEDDAAFTGNVNVNFVYHDPTSNQFTATQPGALIGLDNDDNLSALISEGMVTVELTDDAGNELQLAANKPATLTLPAATDAPASIKVWNLNETNGIWVETGTATKANGKYTFSVDHFSSYNLDYKADNSIESAKFTINNQDNEALQNTTFNLLIDGDATTQFTTDNKGQVEFQYAPQGNYSFKLNSVCDDKFTSNTIAVTSSANYTATVDITTGTVQQYTFSGKVYDCNNNLATNKPFFTTIQIDDATKTVPTYTDASGNYKGQFITCEDISGLAPATLHLVENGTTQATDFSFDLGEKDNSFDLTSCGTIQTISDGTVINFPDSVLDSIIRVEIGKSPSETITYGEVQSIDSIQYFADSWENTETIQSLTGINFLQNLKYFSYGQSYEEPLADLTPLFDCKNLEQISTETSGSIKSINKLTQLTRISLEVDIIDNALDISSLTNLKTFSLKLLNTEDLSEPLEIVLNQPNNSITTFRIYGIDNQLKNYNFISNLKKVDDLNLNSLNLGNLNFLEDVSNPDILTRVEFIGSQINDISKLSLLSNLEEAYIMSNNISNLSTFSNLDKVTNLNIWNNDQITVLTPLKNITDLQHLRVSSNQFSTTQLDDIKDTFPNITIEDW